jgi:hypothetical protein
VVFVLIIEKNRCGICPNNRMHICILSNIVFHYFSLCKKRVKKLFNRKKKNQRDEPKQKTKNRRAERKRKAPD